MNSTEGIHNVKSLSASRLYLENGGSVTLVITGSDGGQKTLDLYFGNTPEGKMKASDIFRALGGDPSNIVNETPNYLTGGA